MTILNFFEGRDKHSHEFIGGIDGLVASACQTWVTKGINLEWLREQEQGSTRDNVETDECTVPLAMIDEMYDTQFE